MGDFSGRESEWGLASARDGLRYVGLDAPEHHPGNDAASYRPGGSGDISAAAAGADAPTGACVFPNVPFSIHEYRCELSRMKWMMNASTPRKPNSATMTRRGSN